MPGHVRWRPSRSRQEKSRSKTWQPSVRHFSLRKFRIAVVWRAAKNTQEAPKQKPTRNQPRTIQQLTRNEAETNQEPSSNEPETSQQPTRNQPETNQKPARDQPGTDRYVCSSYRIRKYRSYKTDICRGDELVSLVLEYPYVGHPACTIQGVPYI